MSFFSAKIVLMMILCLAILILGSFLFLPKSDKSSPPPLPVQKMDLVSPTPFIYSKPRIQPLPSFSPPPVPYENLTQQQKEQYQLKSDEYYQSVQDEILKNYPWYLDLPIKDTYYFVYFDPPSETFIAKLYPQKTISTSIEEQTTNLKKDVTEKIKALGSNAEKYKIDWKVIPE